MSFLWKSKEKDLAIHKNEDREIIVPVPDIKEYLVREYERVNILKLTNASLERQLEEARETELKYKATLVTLDEYSKRLKLSESEIEKQKQLTKTARQELRNAMDEVNSYKIKFNNAAITKAEVEKEVIEETKAAIVSIISKQKGNLSRKAICEIISAYKKDGADNE